MLHGMCPLFQMDYCNELDAFQARTVLGGPDGMTQDAEWNILVAHPMLGIVFVHRVNGELGSKVQKESTPQI
jgi:hypothetical protein